jgi:outer membrane protein assembly factor BamB
MFRNDPARLGRTPYVIPRTEPKILWKADLGQAVYSSPAIGSDETIYAGSLSGMFVAIDRQGKVRWKQNLGGAVFASPALVEQLVIVGTDRDQLLALDQRSGVVRWTFALGPCHRTVGFGPENVRCNADSSPLITAAGEVIFGGDALYALDLSGAQRWKHPLVDHSFSSVAQDQQGNYFLGSRDGAIYSFDRQGGLRWLFRTPYHFDATPAVSGEMVVVGGDDQRIHALSAVDGRVLWELKTRGPVRSSAAIGYDGTVYVGSADGRLYAVRPDGRLRWQYEAEGGLYSSPVVDRFGTVTIGSRDDHLYAIDRSGRLLWRVPLGGDVDSSVAVGPGGRLYLGCDSGELIALAESSPK